jgi:hypothetical protein
VVVESVVYAAAKIGAATAVGRFIDWLLSKSEKRRLQDRLETWWYWFDDVRWRTLGQAEATAAIHVWDRIVGKRLFSIRRLISTLVLVAVCEFVSGDWSFLYLSDDLQEQPFLGLRDHSRWNLVISLLLVPLSFSFTRFLSTLATRTPKKLLPAGFFVLLTANVALFFLWRPALSLITFNVSTLLAGWPNPDVALQSLHFLVASLGLYDFYNFQGALRLTRAQDYIDLATFGIRIAFALVFLCSFLIWPVIHRPVARVWARIVESERPLFTLVLGSIGAAVVLGHELIKLFF